jgi:hypothetical protein
VTEPEVYIKRSAGDDQGTIGVLAIPHLQWRCFVNELPDRNNERCYSRILPGTYYCRLVPSKKFGDVYLLLNVPERSAILMHAGTYAGDTRKGWRSNVLGCIEFGFRVALVNGQRGVLNSRSTRDCFQRLMDGRNFYLTIE